MSCVAAAQLAQKTEKDRNIKINVKKAALVCMKIKTFTAE